MSPIPADARARILDEEVARAARDGWQVASVGAGQAVLQRQKRIGWFWNLILTLVTAGLWLIVVIIRVVNRKIQTLVITVDLNGRVSRRR